MLMPLTTLETGTRGKLFNKYGVECLVFDKRVQFMENKKANWFNTSYFCWKILPFRLMFENLDKEMTIENYKEKINLVEKSNNG